MEGSLIAGRYRVDAHVGEGGVAVVYRGLDISLEREVAIKVLKPQYASDSEIVDRFRREAHAAAKLNHPNIVQIYDTGSENGTHYIIMEYLPEPDFKRIIREYAPLPLRKVLQVSIECCRALAYAHRLGIVHRDVKPHNILFTNDGHAKLSDFGIAAAAGEAVLTGDGMVLGSAHYMSPEQAQGRATGPQSDLYSLGIVMYEALTGGLPFTGKTAAEVAAKHVQERVPALHLRNVNIGPSVEFVVGKALMRDLSRRYRGANEMLMDLEKLADGIELDQTGVLTPSAEDATVRFTAPMLQVLPDPQEQVRSQPAAPDAARAHVRPEPGSDGEPSRATMAAATTAAIIIGIIALVLVIWLVKAAFYPNEPQANIQVPSVTGRTEAEAVEILMSNNLVKGHVDYVYEEGQPKGVVVQQDPPPGATVKEGASINFTVNKGKKQVTVPDVVGAHRDAAEAMLIEKGLRLGSVDEVPREDIEKGLVVRQRIKAGATVDEGTAVDLDISKGPEQPPEELPDTGPVAPGDDDTGPGQQHSVQPRVQAEVDQLFASDKPRERKLRLRVTAQGNEEGQEIKIVVRDELNPRMLFDTRVFNPGDSYEFAPIITGNATVEVLHNGTSVFEHSYMIDGEAGSAGEAGTGSD